jgi:hypothetical protein
MSRSSHSFRFYHPNNIGWWVQIIQLLIMQSPLPCYLVPPRPKYSPQHPILKKPQPPFCNLMIIIIYLTTNGLSSGGNGYNACT